MSLDLFSLAGRAALVTGGNGGLGRAIALGLREAGARVAVTGRDPAKNAAMEAELGEQIRRKTPTGRWGDPRDLVGAAIFLASAASKFVTGIAIPVDGGYAVADRLRSG